MILPNYTSFRAVFSVTGTPDVSGYEAWPSAKVRSGGFVNTVTGLPSAIIPSSFLFAPTCNGHATDAVPGVDDYDIYVSQRSDIIAEQYWTVFPYIPVSDTMWRSGSLGMIRSDLGFAKYPDPLTEDSLIALYKHVTIYWKRRSDGAIQVSDLTKSAFSDAT